MNTSSVLEKISMNASTPPEDLEQGAYCLSELSSENPEVQKRIEIANAYLATSSGANLYLSENQFTSLANCIENNRDALLVTNVDLAEMQLLNAAELHSSIQASTIAVQAEVRAVGTLVEACHVDAVEKMNMLQSSINLVNQNVCAVGANVAAMSKVLVELQQDFLAYIEVDARANNVQHAETKLVQLNQKLESDFGHNKQLRRTAVGILQAADMKAIRADTILTTAEQLCVQTPNYWLAPAIVAVAQWVELSQSSVSREQLGSHLQVITNMLNEAYRRERAKTALFFGMICRRANNVTRAHEWFMEYLSYQRPEAVDHTCVAFLNVYASGLMGNGREEREAAEVLAGWRDKLMADPEGRHVKSVVNDWKNTCQELYLKGALAPRTFTALPAFCPEAWPKMQQVLQASTIHRELRAFLEYELSSKDFEASDTEMIDSIIAGLVTSYDADELPIRREQEYEKLIVDLDGDEKLARMLRGVKDDILSETKTFVSVLSDAARSSRLTAASAATHVLSIKMQMPWIKQAYEELTTQYRSATPKEIPIVVDNFTATTIDGSNEDKVIDDFVSFVNKEERDALEASKPGMIQVVALIGGAIVALLGFILTFVGGSMWLFVAFLGAAAALYGFMAGRNARMAQKNISTRMKQKRLYGTLVLRKVMQEVRDWRRDYAAGDSLMADNIDYMNGYILE